MEVTVISWAILGGAAVEALVTVASAAVLLAPVAWLVLKGEAKWSTA
jgi:hypothetical protein